LERVLHDRKFGYSREGALLARESYGALATLVRPTSIEPTARDHDDDLVLGTAIASDADAIVTRDRDLLDLGTAFGIQIMRPAAFLARLEQG
ncbi:MAG: putative toxin-antitoxin system toxin component, PIN family, partial [Actinomycetota bacterium]|nr:putative toxin-antitoxin system toxin component, PIN family [Actinomycetota bacterium]